MCEKLGNGATYGGEILHADPCGACNGHGLGLMSIGGRHWGENCTLKTTFQPYLMMTMPLIDESVDCDRDVLSDDVGDDAQSDVGINTHGETLTDG